jgi:DNA polymerase III subunit delta
MPAALKPAYLVHGEDHGAIAERRARLRALAEAHGHATSVELIDAQASTPAAVAQALATMTFAISRRVILVEGVERWRQADVQQHLLPAMATMPPDTTLALFAREELRAKAPAAVHEAVTNAGGQVVAHVSVKPWELPTWVREQASKLGLSLDVAAAKALVAQVGERQQRLLRELEKLALERGAYSEQPVAVSVEEIESRVAHSAGHRAYTLADALLAGDTARALRSYMALHEQGERLSGLTYLVARRLREALSVSLRLAAGESPSKIKQGLKMPPKAAAQLIAEVSRSEPQRLHAALGTLSDLELNSRGGSPVSATRSPDAALSEETLALATIQAIAPSTPHSSRGGPGPGGQASKARPTDRGSR